MIPWDSRIAQLRVLVGALTQRERELEEKPLNYRMDFGNPARSSVPHVS